MHDINIKRVTNGVIVTIGCHTFVHNNIAEAMKWIQQYLSNPAAAMKQWQAVVLRWYKLQEEANEQEPDQPPPEFQTACEQDRPGGLRARERNRMESSSSAGAVFSGNARS
jgi:hypothetical protein